MKSPEILLEIRQANKGKLVSMGMGSKPPQRPSGAGPSQRRQTVYQDGFTRSVGASQSRHGPGLYGKGNSVQSLFP